LRVVSTAKAAACTWGNVGFALRREARWGRVPAEAAPTWPDSLGSRGVLAGVRPEGASCDLAKMVFTDPS
jgi:hypothetical protein